MAGTFEQVQAKKTAFRLSFLGVGMLALAVSVMAIGILQHEDSSAGAIASYTANQEVRSQVEYFDNSFFGRTPRQSNNSFIAELTRLVQTKFGSVYTFTSVADLTYSVRVDAAVRGTYPVAGDKETLSSVWQKDYSLAEPKQHSETTNVLNINQSVDVPFADYKKVFEDFKKTLDVPVQGEVVVTAAVEVKGTVNGTPFQDSQNMVVKLPLSDEIYQPSYQFEKERQGVVTPAQSKSNQANLEKILFATSVALAVAGVGLIVYAKRAQIFKSSYRRELDKIYSLHEGIIVRASRHPDLRHKTIVRLQRFDDMLNLEEELRSPIIASEASEAATRFLIIKGDMVYMYVLGTLPSDDEDVMYELEEAFSRDNEKIESQNERKKPSTKKPRLIQQ